MIGEIKPIASLVGVHREYAAALAYVTGLDVLPLGRVVNDAKVTDHHAIIPTNSDQRIDKLSDDDRRVYDMVVRRFLAVFHPDAVFENTRLETTVLGVHLPDARPRAAGGRLAWGLRRDRGRVRLRRRRGRESDAAAARRRARPCPCSKWAVRRR